jgi:hypothetical protein
MSKFRICLIVSCWKRPARTRRMLNNILAQNINNWEAFVLGDGCPVYNTLLESGEAKFYQELAESKGNKLHMFNFEKNYGGYGYNTINYGIANTNAKYVIFAGNDDILAPDHFQHYLSEIENTEHSMVIYKTYMKFLPSYMCFRPPVQIPFNYTFGHAEIIVKTSEARLFKHSPDFGHDWDFILKMHNLNRTKISNSSRTTYYVTHTSITDISVPVTFETID